MASIVERKGRYYVVYSIMDEVVGKQRQKWESFANLAEAKRRKTEVEYRQDIGKMVIPQCKTVNELLNEYVALYGKSIWSMSVYTSNTGLIRNYIAPHIGKMPLNEITARVLEKYYLTLLKTEAVPSITDKKYQKTKRLIGAPTVRKVHNVLRSAFSQAMKWDLMERNPATLATVPKFEPKKRDIWDAPTLFKAIELCQDDRLKLCINLSFACSLRLGEILGLTWDCVDVSEESMLAGKPSIYINKELQRVRKVALLALDKKDVIATFPEKNDRNQTVLLLKKPKTATSIRKVFLPKTVAQMLIAWKQEQDVVKDALGDEYQDYSLVITGPLGTPLEGGRIETAFRKLIIGNELPYVVFHSLRHTSITYKLKLSGGDIKAVQGDSRHAQAKMVTDQYSHILDESRSSNALLIEEAFYGGHGAEHTSNQVSSHHDDMAEKANEAGIDPELLAQILGNPEMVNLLKTLSKTLGK